MSALRARMRREDRARARERWPVVPGVLPDVTDEWTRHALAEAHDVLPHVPGTQVSIIWFEPGEGLDKVELLFGPAAHAVVADKLDAEIRRGAPHPVVTFATRRPRDRR
jgi:hypothetical protein